MTIYIDDQRVADHPRCGPGQRSTVETHLPDHRRDLRHRGRPESAATHFLIVTSCMMVGIDPFDYLRDVLHRLPDATPDVLRQLTPSAWAGRA